MSNLSSDAAEYLWRAIERNRDWIKSYVLAPETREQDVEPYVKWIYHRLKDHIPEFTVPEDLDRLVRREVRRLFARDVPNGSRKALFGDVGELEDPSALGFERKVELSDEVRACLQCLRKHSRDLIIEAFTLTEAEVSGKDARDRLAARLGINRNTLDQRISRALRLMRRRMRHRLGWE